MHAGPLRSTRLTLWVVSALAAVAALSTLLPPGADGLPWGKTLEGTTGAVARALGLAGTFRSPPFLALVLLLCVNIAACLAHRLSLARAAARAGRLVPRTRARLALDAAVHVSLLLVVAGATGKSLWGFAGTQSVHVGFETGTAYEPATGRDVPLGFAVRILEREDSFHPLEVLVGVREAASGEKVALAELRERVARRVDGTELTLEPLGLDEEAGVVVLRAGGGGRAERIDLQVRGNAEERRVPFGPYLLTPVAYRRELREVRAHVAIEEQGRRVAEGWVSPRSKVTHRGVGLALVGWGADPSGVRFVSLQFTRDPAAPLFWAGCVLLALTLPAFVVVRARRPAA